MDKRGCRLELGTPKGRETLRREDLLLAGKRGLGLSEAEAEKLARQPPASLLLAPMEDGERARLVSRLRGAGLDVREEESRGQHRPCPAHPRLASDRVCPKCSERRACAACVELCEPAVCAACADKLRARRGFRNLRIAALLLILVAVSLTTYLQNRRVGRWSEPLRVRLFPIAGDRDAETHRFLAGLDMSAFRELEAFFDQEGRRYGVPSRPVIELSLGPVVSSLPPKPPEPPSLPSVIAWSLRLRWWAFQVSGDGFWADPGVRLFVVYHRAEPGLELEHSLGLDKGHLGVAHLFADPDAQTKNNVVIAHELLHTAGASDKYDPEGQPLFPEGYAEPQKSPRYPQRLAEIMGGRLPLTEDTSRMPSSLFECVVGPTTAKEVRWVAQ